MASFLSAGSAACVAEVGSFPFDTAKVRMQIQGSAARPGVPYRHIGDALRRIAAEEGIATLYNGLAPGLQRQMLLAGTRLSLYE